MNCCKSAKVKTSNWAPVGSPTENNLNEGQQPRPEGSTEPPQAVQPAKEIQLDNSSSSSNGSNGSTPTWGSAASTPSNTFTAAADEVDALSDKLRQAIGWHEFHNDRAEECLSEGKSEEAEYHAKRADAWHKIAQQGSQMVDEIGKVADAQFAAELQRAYVEKMNKMAGDLLEIAPSPEEFRNVRANAREGLRRVNENVRLLLGEPL